MNKILIIDNEFEIVEMISEMLSLHDYDVKTALDGENGIQSAIKFHPDLILCDISMPNTNGYAVLEALRNDKRTHAIPFIFLTAMGGMQDLRKGMRLGADDYLTKPVSADELIAAVKTRLEKHHQITNHFQNEIEQTKYHLEITRNFDETTNLPKKVVLERKLKQLATTVSPNSTIALLIIKFNRFKNITDIFGKNDYLKLIHELVKRIENETSIEKNTYILNDDELGIPLNSISSKKGLTQLANSILSAIRLPVAFENREINCNASIGLSLSTNYISAEELISYAEIAVNAALEDGFNTFKFYEDKLKKHAIDRMNLDSALNKALERGEFTLNYQPKIDSINQNIIGSEALIRWKNSDYGLISPQQFIPIAEENGLIIPIGEWVLETICNQLNEWKRAGINPIPVAINISARQLEQKNFVKSISSILEKTRIENELLEIELTESILIKNSQNTSRKLTKLRKSGMKVAIDDFGTGYSSLAYLTNFPFDKLKIDQSFIRDIVTDKAAASLATSIISMAHRLGVRVIAEGVETEDQLKFLKDYKCDEIQGYYFSEPVSADNFTSLLKNNSFSF
jgi:EAL domain-containing protein (putative c-di-GMP-specific phosphodiesterase class I)/PleD family two-component response regulator